jgi:hypothetical protein
VVEDSTEEDAVGIQVEVEEDIRRKGGEIGDLGEEESNSNGRILSLLLLQILRMMLEEVVALIGQDGSETGLLPVWELTLLDVATKTLQETRDGTNKEPLRLEQKEPRRLTDQGIAQEKLNGALRVQPREAPWMWRTVEAVRIGQEETENGTTRVRPAHLLLLLEETEVDSPIGKIEIGIGVIVPETLTKEEVQTRHQVCLRDHQR